LERRDLRRQGRGGDLGRGRFLRRLWTETWLFGFLQWLDWKRLRVNRSLHRLEISFRLVFLTQQFPLFLRLRDRGQVNSLIGVSLRAVCDGLQCRGGSLGTGLGLVARLFGDAEGFLLFVVEELRFLSISHLSGLAATHFIAVTPSRYKSVSSACAGIYG